LKVNHLATLGSTKISALGQSFSSFSAIPPLPDYLSFRLTSKVIKKKGLADIFRNKLEQKIRHSQCGWESLRKKQQGFTFLNGHPSMYAQKNKVEKSFCIKNVQIFGSSCGKAGCAALPG
jgi:hypothetical protein